MSNRDEKTTNLTILAQVNAITKRNDTVWWSSIINHRLQTRAISEAKRVKRLFQNVSQTDAETTKRLAELINTGEMDLVTFEAEAGAPDDTGKRPTLQAVRQRRQAKEIEAREDSKIELAKENEKASQVEAGAALEEPAGTPIGKSLEQPSGSDAQGIVQVIENEKIIEQGENEPNYTSSSRPGHFTPSTATTRSTSDAVGDPPQQALMDTSGPPGSISTPMVGPELESAGDISNPYVARSNPNSHPEQQSVADNPRLPGESLKASVDLSNSFVEPTSKVYNEYHTESRQPPQPSPSNLPRRIDVANISALVTPAQDSDYSAHASATAPPSSGPRSLWQNIKWAYLTHTPADIELQKHGIWLYEKPLTGTSNAKENDITNLQLQPDCCVVISSDFEDHSEPSMGLTATTLAVHTHLPPWADDDRSFNNFAGLLPDFQSDVPLAEYQTIEALGSYVWRHDRDHLPCRGPNCKKMLSDTRPTTLICLGCGPKSIVRFCSVRCHLASLPTHAVECWSSRLLINKLIDHNTTPGRFSHQAPALRDRHGYRTYQNYRQRVAAHYSGGRYSMFNPATEEATVLIWDERFSAIHGRELPYPGYATEMEACIERCLNIALFDHTNTPVVEHLYRRLQLCLRVKNAWNPALAAVLTRQFRREFDWDASTSARVRADEPFCECEWSGGAVRQHQETCSSRWRGQGEVIQSQWGVEHVVQAMEDRHWILRAWRQQHPTELVWTHRVMGVGFPGVVVEEEGWMPRLGKGWVGVNGEDDDVVG
ncbi:MAG: hypothetical protein Q9182_005150 [Xanthomendoza sp. 2 TL-2023]